MLTHRSTQMGNNQKKIAGFTIMEVVVATTIFAIVFSSLLALFNYTLKINRRSESIRQASQGIRNFVENLVKEIRNGQVSYGIVDPAGNQISTNFPVGPCSVPSTAVSAGSDTYSDQENKLALYNTDGVEECVFFGDSSGAYLGANVFSTSTGGTLVLQKVGQTAQILNTPNTRVENLKFLIRPVKDPYVSTGGFEQISPVITIYLKFVVTLPTGETTTIYYQTSVASSQYDIPNS